MTKKLKPCPFCGCKADVNVLPKFDDYKQVFCPTCGACNVWGDDAVKRWNRRSEIKRCPICGAKARSHEAFDSTWVIQCSKCHLTSPHKSTREEAIRFWNRRVNDEA